jgi:protein SCO1/2
VIAWLATACWQDPSYIVEGTVVELQGPTRVVVDHADVPGLMPAMVMPFDVADPSLLADVRPGSRILARYELSEGGSKLTAVRVTGQGPAPRVATGPAPLRLGEHLPAFELPTHDGATVVLGPGQQERVALTFLYTRCPLPEFCPAMVGRLAALQQALGDAPGARLVAVTLDPAHDTLPVLATYARDSGAGPRWSMARLEPGPLADLAMYAGLSVLAQDDDTIAHGTRLLVLDRGGRFVERYDDTRFPLDRVVSQLTTGAPDMPPGNSGTVTPPPNEGGAP